MAPPSPPRFRLLGELGRGGMAVVHLAHDESTGRRVALKLLHAHLADRPSARRRLERELAATRAVDHPAVVRVEAQVTHAGQLGLVLPLFTGGTLAEAVAAAGPLSVERLTELLDVLTGSLLAAHAAGVLHRDVTPGNVLLDPRHSPPAFRLTDFGLAHLAGGATATTTALGTPGYAAPETGGPGAADPSLDAWAVGAVLYFAATGRPPFGSDAPQAVLARQLAGSPERPLAQARPDLPAALVATVEGLLCVDPSARLTLAQARHGPEPRPAVPAPRPRGRLRPGPVGATVSLAAVVAVGCVQDFGSFLLSTVLDGHAVPRADVFAMTQGVSALALLPLALAPAVAGALVATEPDPLAGRRWAGVALLAIADLLYAMLAGVVLPELGMRGSADLFGTMLFHQMAFLPLAVGVVLYVRPWRGLRAPPEAARAPDDDDPLATRTRSALASLRQALSRAPDVVRLDLHESLRTLSEATEQLARRRAELRALPPRPTTDPVETLAARLARAEALGTPDRPALADALAEAEAARADHDHRDRAWTRSAAQLVEVQAAALAAHRALVGGDPTVPVTAALQRLRGGVEAARAARREVEQAPLAGGGPPRP